MVPPVAFLGLPRIATMQTGRQTGRRGRRCLAVLKWRCDSLGFRAVASDDLFAPLGLDKKPVRARLTPSLYPVAAGLLGLALATFAVWVMVGHDPLGGERKAIVVGFAAFVICCLMLAFARSVGAVFWAQVPRAVAIGLVTYLGISFLQTMMPHRAGAAAALFSNAGQLGSVLAALGVGALAKAFGFTAIFFIGAGLSAAGLVLVCLTPAVAD